MDPQNRQQQRENIQKGENLDIQNNEFKKVFQQNLQQYQDYINQKNKIKGASGFGIYLNAHQQKEDNELNTFVGEDEEETFKASDIPLDTIKEKPIVLNQIHKNNITQQNRNKNNDPRQKNKDDFVQFGFGIDCQNEEIKSNLQNKDYQSLEQNRNQQDVLKTKQQNDNKSTQQINDNQYKSNEVQNKQYALKDIYDQNKFCAQIKQKQIQSPKIKEKNENKSKQITCLLNSSIKLEEESKQNEEINNNQRNAEMLIEEAQNLKEQKDKEENEKKYYKLADYFITVGIDDYYTQEEYYNVRQSPQDNNLRQSTAQISTSFTDHDHTTDAYSKSFINRPSEQAAQIPDFTIIDNQDNDFDRVVSKLEILVINDQTIFQKDLVIGGAHTNLKRPDDINIPNEKWIDLRGDKTIYLKVTYEDIKKCKRPISDLNYYKISKYQNLPDKMQIQVKQGIEPIPVKIFGDPESDKKFNKTKKLGKNGNKNEDMYNFYGDYDLTNYFEKQNDNDQTPQKKNLCLCQSIKKQAPIQDIILVIGQQINQNEIESQNNKNNIQNGQNITLNWDVPEGYRKLAYSVGTNGVLNRLLCLKIRDLTKRKLKARVLDRYPVQSLDRHYYPFPHSISDFCFPAGIVLKSVAGQPEFFNFSLTDQDGVYIYGSCLVFDEEPSRAFKEKLKTYFVKNISNIRTLKAICILSHYSFNNSFKEILKQLYRMQQSNSWLNIPIEKFIINIIDEIPLPDEGKILVQHELGGQTVSFFRPIDQNPPFVENDEIENLFRCLNVDNIIEIFSYILLERKVLVISSHKALLTQVINCFASFLFPFKWQHTFIPILPLSMIDVLEAPFPYMIGIEPNLQIQELDLDNEVLKVDLDNNMIEQPKDFLMQSQVPQLPPKEFRQLKQRLNRASEYIKMIPDFFMMQQVDLAFNRKFADPDEDEQFNHLEIRDSFLEFMSCLMSGYTKYMKDLSDQPDIITSSKECFELDKFRLQKDAKKPYSFIYKLTETIHFTYFIECRALGQTQFDQQIMHFEKLLNQKRTLMKPRLIFPFAEEKSIKAMHPLEDALSLEETWNYNVFPKLNSELFYLPRQIPDYNKDSIYQQIMGSLIRNDELQKMHDDEWARYMSEILYLLWFQVFCSTLPIYGPYAPQLIDFARRLLNYIKGKLKPMKDVEFIYRRLFQSCGTCKQINELKECYNEMKKAKIQPDKVTSGTYYQALLECKRRGGAKEDMADKKRSYFAHRIEDYQDRLSQNYQQNEDANSLAVDNRYSNLSASQPPNLQINNRLSAQAIQDDNLLKKSEFGSKIKQQHSRKISDIYNKRKSGMSDINHFIENNNFDDNNIQLDYNNYSKGVDFCEFLDRPENHLVTQQTELETQFAQNNRASGPLKLSYVLENMLYIDIEKLCSKCKEPLREEELFSGFQKNLSNYLVKCPICKAMFVPKFCIYSEQDSSFLNGRKGQSVSLLPPVTLYKEFFNILMKEGDQILMSDKFINNHKIVFWNIILYFKILRLPFFMLDLDYSPNHQKIHCSQIKKFLPIEKQNIQFKFGRKSSINSRQQSNAFLPPTQKLDSSALKKLNEIESSPLRTTNAQTGSGSGGVGIQGLLNFNNQLQIGNKSGSQTRTSNVSASAANSVNAPQSTGRPSSIKRVANTVINMFSSNKKNKAENQNNDQNSIKNLDSQQNNAIDSLPSCPDLNFEGLVSSNLQVNQASLPPKNNTQQKSIRQQIINAQNSQLQQVSINQQVSGSQSQAVENDKKGFQGLVGGGISNIMNNFKKASSNKGGGSQKSGGPGSVCTSLSDLEKIEKIMNEAVHANKSVVKYFGQYFEEFRREMYYNKEIVLSDMLTQQ